MSNHLLSQDIDALTADLCAAVAALPLEARVEALNRIRRALHQVSPFRAEPVDCVEWVPADQVEANDYNPNSVAGPEMRLLQLSIQQDGYTQPIVTMTEGTQRRVIDGYHRNRVGREVRAIRDRLHGYLPVTAINSSRTSLRDRMAATIRHNRARGVHGVRPMGEIVATLIREGWNDEEVARELGMDADEVLRFKQNMGLPELFKDHAFSPAWE